MPRMRGPLRLILLPCVALAALALPGAAAAADKPSAKTLYYEGPSGRYLLDGEWLFRLDPGNQGLGQRLEPLDAAAPAGRRVKVPNVWNLGDDSPRVDDRRRRLVPQGLLAARARAGRCAWAVRFESVNYRSRVWLNGRRVGTNRGAYIPFELRLAALKRRGTNRLVIRVDSKRRPTDFPPSGLATTGVPTGGWWNYSGLQREVYLKRLDTVDWKSVRGARRCCRARAARRPSGSRHAAQRRAERASASASPARFGVAPRRPRHARHPGQRGDARSRPRFRVPRPRVWSPAKPEPLPRQPARERRRAHASARYRLRTGIRSIRVCVDGRLMLNGAAREPPRRRRARGLQGAGLRGRQRVPRAARGRDQGGRRDDDAHALPDAPLHARAGRPAGRADLVGGPGLRDQDREPRARTS